MRYCPYCSESVSLKAKTCHNCKHLLEIDVLEDALDTAEESEIKKAALRKIKIKENMRFVWPVITLIIGFVMGGVILYLMAMVQFSIEKDSLSLQIDSLHNQISELRSMADNAQGDLQNKIQSKEKVIGILGQQRSYMASIINFTRRFSERSAITATSEEDITYFRNNFIYLRKQFLNQQDMLDSTDFTQSGRYNLKTIPQFLED